jgi:sec-independent protein translocase protein TatA
MGDALAPWHIILLVIVLVLLFGAKRLPGAAQSLGRSMHIFRRSVQGEYQDDDSTSLQGTSAPQATTTPAPSVLPPAQDGTQQQLADLQRQVADLQRQSAGSNGGTASGSQSAQPL